MLQLNKGSHTKALIIWLHGLGADSNDFFPFFNIKEFENYHIVIPNAPLRPVSLNQNMLMRAWFDMKNLTLENFNESDFIDSSQIIDKIINDFNHDKVIIGRFSQGAALSLYYGATSNNKINGIVCFSGFLPNFSYAHKNMDTPILKIHGTHDDIIDIGVSQQSMSQINFSNLNSKSYNMGHNVVNEQISDFLDFLEKL